MPEVIDLPALQRLHQAHVGAIAFENLDVQWRRTVRIDPASVCAKLLGSARGGYCFEQNTLFREVLRARGVAVTAREARVRSGATSRRARTHMTLVVTIDGADYLCDVGLRRLHAAPAGAARRRAEPQHAWVYRIAPEGSLLVLQWQRDGGWQDLYAIEPGEPGEVDFEMANWYTCTWPEGGFIQTMTAQRATPEARYTLRNYTLTEDSRRRQVHADAAPRGDRAGAARRVRPRRARRREVPRPRPPTATPGRSRVRPVAPAERSARRTASDPRAAARPS